MHLSLEKQKKSRLFAIPISLLYYMFVIRQIIKNKTDKREVKIKGREILVMQCVVRL